MDTNKITTAIEFAKNNPDSAYATELRRRIESGSLNNELQSAGLTQFIPKGSVKEPNILQNIATDITQPFESVGGSFKAGVEALGSYLGNKKEYNKAGMNLKDVYKASLEKNNQDNTLTNVISEGATQAPARDITTGQGVEQLAGDLGKGLLDVATLQAGSTLSPVKSSIGALAKQGAKYGAGYGVTGSMQEGGNISDILTSGLEGGATGAVLGAGLGVASKGISKGVNLASDLANKTKNIISNKLPPPDGGGGAFSGISPEIMNRVARVNPTDANNFKNLTGESIGEYLTKTGNFGAPDEIITNEASKFTKALIAKDTAMASLPGTYKNGAMEDLINGIKEKALATSGGNVKSPYLKTATTLENKLKKDGLTMKEISDAIRLYEKEIKLGYNKTLNPEKVQLATNIDRAAREFQDATAKQLGFENLPELNKQIQTSRAIVDSLGKKVVSNDLLNGVSLTDYITLSGGNPESVGMFLTKKIFSNKGVQAKIAKMLSETASPSEIKAIIGETKFPRLEVGKTKVPTQDLPINLTAKGRTQSQADINLQKILKDRGTIPENSLILEAKKYKSAEEFVKAQGTPVYHGTNKNFDVFDVTKKGSTQGFDEPGIFFTSDRNVAKTYNADYVPKPKYKLTPEEAAKNDKLQIKEVVIKDSDFKDLIQQLDEAYVYDEIKTKPDFDGVRPSTFFDMNREAIKELLKARPEIKGLKVTSEGQTVYMVTDADLIKTRTQLEDIWNKANKK